MKKFFQAAAVLTAAAMLAGCSGNAGNKQSGTETSFEFGKDPLKFSLYMNYDYMAAKPWAQGSPIEEWIRDNKKVEIEYMDPGGAASQRMVTMIASNSLPDCIMMENNQDLQKMISSNLLVPLDDYMEKYPYTKNDLGEGILNLIESEDGKTYQIPNWANSVGNPNGNSGWVINTKVYEELGSPKLETFEDLYQYLQAVKNKYGDMIPVMTNTNLYLLDIIMQGYQDGMSYPLNFKEVMLGYPKDGKFASVFESEAYRQAILYVNRLFREGLLSKDTFTQTDDQIKEKLRNGRVAVFTGDCNTINGTREDMLRQGSDWKYIFPIRKEGKPVEETKIESFDMLGSSCFVISRNAKNPEGIYAYLDWLYSPEGQATYFYGPTGMHWDTLNEQGYPEFKPEFFETPFPVLRKEMLGNGMGSPLGNTSWVDGCAKYVYEQTPEENRDWVKTQQYNVIWKTSENRTEFRNVVPPLSTEAGVNYQTIVDSYKEVVAKMVFASDSNEVTALLDEFIAETKENGIDEILEIMTQNWENNKKLLSNE